MSVRKQKFQFYIKGFQKILKQMLRVKKSFVGLLILIFFAIVAIGGPLITNLDPIKPGSVRNPDDLPVAETNCVPSWYQGENITHNLNVIEGATWQYKATDNCANISYNNEAKEFAIAFKDTGNVTLSLNFSYPYIVQPPSFRGQFYYLLNASNEAPRLQNNIMIVNNFKTKGLREIKTYQVSPILPLYFEAGKMNKLTLYKDQITNYNAYLRTLYAETYGKEVIQVIFAKVPANYTYEIVIQFNGNVTQLGNPTLYLKNIQLVIYGNSYGIFGTDWYARDIFTQLVDGTRISFMIGIISAIISVAIGLIYGLASGYIGGITDEVMMRFNDMLLVLPTLPLLLVLVFVLGQSFMNIILVVGLLGWMGFARTVRSAVLSLKERPFIEAARAAGAGRGYIMIRHIVPNVMPLVYVTLASSVPGAIISEAALSWLGLGPTDVMSWGRILSEFERSGAIATGALTRWYWVIPPGICICLLSLSFILIGYALDEILNPKLRERR
ncbi:MAG: ABC transporter permease [Candidatus Bathyarchaeia archaeon]